MSDKTFNAADELQVGERKKQVKQGRERELDDLRSLLDSKQGRRFMWRYLGECGVFRTSFTGSSNQTCFNEGRRDIGLRLMADVMEAAPEQFIVMQREATE